MEVMNQNILAFNF